MANPQPKPAEGGAEQHRNDDEDEDEGVETAEVPGTPVDGGGDDDGGSGGGGQPPADSSAGTLAGISWQKVALAAGAAIALYLLYRYLQQEGGVAAIERGQPPGAEEDGVGEEEQLPDIPQDENDPLATDDVVGEIIFDGWGS